MSKANNLSPFPAAISAAPVRAATLARIASRVARERHVQGTDGIGTLGEKRMHTIFKELFCADAQYHEVALEGTRYVADIKMGNEIIEIQTGALAPMRKKISYYLEKTDCTVTVVHPVAVKRQTVWIDPATREIAHRTRPTVAGRDRDLLAELFPLRDLFPHPRLSFHLLYIEAVDFRILSPRGTRGRGARRYERIPTALLGEESFCEARDFVRFLPDTLPAHFTVKDFSAATGIRGVDAYSAVRVLCSLGLIEEAAPIGRAMAFRRTTENPITTVAIQSANP